MRSERVSASSTSFEEPGRILARERERRKTPYIASASLSLAVFLLLIFVPRIALRRLRLEVLLLQHHRVLRVIFRLEDGRNAALQGRVPDAVADVVQIIAVRVEHARRLHLLRRLRDNCNDCATDLHSDLLVRDRDRLAHFDQRAKF